MTRWASRKIKGKTEWRCDKCQGWHQAGFVREERGDSNFICLSCESEEKLQVDKSETKKDLEVKLEPLDIIILEALFTKVDLVRNDLFVKTGPTISSMVRTPRVVALRNIIQELATELRAGGSIDVPSRY